MLRMFCGMAVALGLAYLFGAFVGWDLFWIKGVGAWASLERYFLGLIAISAAAIGCGVAR